MCEELSAEAIECKIQIHISDYSSSIYNSTGQYSDVISDVKVYFEPPLKWPGLKLHPF